MRKEPTHVDDFADRFSMGDQTEAVKYARWFFFLHRLAAVYLSDWRPWISQYKLFCTYKGRRYRVTGASRMGDVWLAEDLNRETGYDHRVSLDDCTDWAPTASGEHHDPAVAAIKYAATQGVSASEFLNAWLEGDWETIQREWPDAPKEVIVK